MRKLLQPRPQPYLLVILILVGSIVSGQEYAIAQANKQRDVSLACYSSASLSCAVYDACFEKACGCESTKHRYFISYGKKYCDRFLGAMNWSDKGRKWRDRTLRCLQEKIVPHLPLKNLAAGCNCNQLKTTAFRSHVECYTQPDASICDLGVGDWWKISNVIDKKDLFQDKDGRRQMLEVARVCLVKSVTEEVKALMRRIIELLEGDQAAEDVVDEFNKQTAESDAKYQEYKNDLANLERRIDEKLKRQLEEERRSKAKRRAPAASRPTASKRRRSADPRCGKARQQMQAYRNYLRNSLPANARAQVLKGMRGTQSWIRANC